MTSSAEHLQSPSLSQHQVLKKYLWVHLPVLLVATLMSVVLGGVAALIGTLVGPAVHVLGAPADQLVSLKEMFGPYLGPFFVMILGQEEIRSSVLLLSIPPTLIALGVLKAGFNLAGWYIWETVGERASKELRSDIVRGYLQSDPNSRGMEASRKMEANLSSSVSTDIRMMREYIIHFFGGFPRELAQVLFLVVVVFLLSPKLASIFFLAVLPASALASNLGRKLRRRASKALENYSQLTEWLQQRLLGVESIKHYKTESLEAAKMQQLTESLYDKFLGAVKVKARTSPLLEIISVFFFMIVLGVALFDIYSGRSTGAILLSFFASLAFLLQSAGKIGRYYNTNREGVAAVDRIRAMLSHYQDFHKPSVEIPTIKGETNVTFEAVSYRYPGSKEFAVSGIDLRFEPGKIYCLTGPSGSGKSTLVSLLLGLLKPSSGSIQWSRRGGDPCVYMPQKVQLAPASVLENVIYPHIPGEAIEKRVVEALKKSGAWEFVSSLDEGVNTIIGSEGRSVSGGQAQRILLARLWYHPGELVLIDEGTSALDPEMEAAIYSLQRELAEQGRIVVTIAHRPGAAAAADVLVALAEGKLHNQA